MHCLFLDESERGEVLGLGGMFLRIDDMPAVRAKWRHLKSQAGLSAEHEVKWSLPKRHPTRVKLGDIGASTRGLCEACISCLSTASELTCIVVVMEERRASDKWKRLLGRKTSVRDFYPEALRYNLQRFAREVHTNNLSGPHFVVIDTPELPSTQAPLRELPRETTFVAQASELGARYMEWCLRGCESGPQTRNLPCPDSLGFHPALLESHAKYDDFLQMADVIVGCTTAWVQQVRAAERGKKTNIDWHIDQVRSLKPRFRVPMFGDGFVFWPEDLRFWETLKSSLRR